MFIQLFFCLLLFALASTPGQAQFSNSIEQYYFLQDRLASGLVFDILQDRQGFMWFATEYGLVKYDGKNLVSFKSIPKDTTSLAGDVIYRLAEDRDGQLWVGGLYNGLHRFDPYTETFTRYQYDPLDPNSLPKNRVNDLLADDQGNIWVATHGGGISLFDEKSNSFQKTKSRTGQEVAPQNAFVTDILEVDKNQLWIATAQGLERWNISHKKVISSEILPNPEDRPFVLKTLREDRLGNFWIGTKYSGLFRLSAKTGQYEHISLIESDKEPAASHIWRIIEDKYGHFWVATDEGLFYLVGQNGDDSSSAFTVSKFNGAPVKRALCLYESRDGVIWIGTNSGVLVLIPRDKPFQQLRALKTGENPGTTRGITTIDQGRHGEIWVGTVSGLFQVDPKQMRLHQNFLLQYPELGYFDQLSITALCTDSRNQIWISTVKDFGAAFQVFCYKKDTGQLIDYSDRCPSFHTHVTNSITETLENNLWFSSANGLVRYFSAQDSFLIYQHESENEQSLGSNNINMVVAKKDTLWVGTNDTGLDKLEVNTDRFYHYYPKAGDPAAISNQQVKNLLEDKKGHLWLGTAGGLNHFNPERGKFRSFSTEQGLPENLIKSMVQDEHGDIWLSMPHWLSRFEVKTETISNYGLEDGIRIKEFQARKALKDSVGRMYFGADNGLVVFYPDSIQPNPFAAPVVLTDFWLFNKRVAPNIQSKTLPVSINLARQITLGPKENVFTFHFAALSYINPQRNSYAYQLEGFDPDWQMVGVRTEATYTNLEHGKYTFKVKAANNDGIWNGQETKIQLIILPPWYQTWWAYVLFTGFSLTFLGLLYRFHLNRQLQLLENLRLQELDAVKTRFFTNISHEFRTPVTIILGLSDQLKTQVSEGVKSSLDIIHRNGHQLLFLVNQLLDLSKLESGHIQLKLHQDDIVHFLKCLVESFHSYATENLLNLYFVSELDALTMDFDPDRLQQIISNLLSNAMKYTPAKGQVEVLVRVRDHQLEIGVTDTGVGIAEKDLPHIFDRFFRSNDVRHDQVDGAGLGLALTKELVKLMAGNIEVNSTFGKGTSFTVYLPVKNKAPITSKMRTGEVLERQQTYFSKLLSTLALEKMKEKIRAAGQAKSITAGSDSPLLLLIEDNVDMVSYLIACLESNYQIEVAYNGREGLEKAFELIPDLILSDVMMPEMDGFEVSRRLKSDLRTSHVPIILLTAKADADSRLSGLRQGVEAYLVKPFYKKELLVRVKAILERRKRLQVYYASLAGLNPIPEDESIPEEVVPENPFLESMRSIVEENIADHKFHVPHLCRALGMSHPQLHRKLKALTGCSVGQYIKSIRMRKAQSLLTKEKDWTIAAIAYEVGFTDPDYFSKVFKSEVGVPPSQFRGQ